MILFTQHIERLMSRRKSSKKTQRKELMDVICTNIACVILEEGLYPGTKDFDVLYQKLIQSISDQIKVNVIKIIRKTIDS